MKNDPGSSLNDEETPIDWSRVKRILLIRLRSIGDTVLMTPCLEALKAWHPELHISVVSEPLAAPLLEDHPLLDQMIVARRSLRARASLITQLRKSRFELVFNMHGGSTGAILARLAGARHSVGYRGLPLSWLLSDRAPSPDAILRRSRIHSVEQQLALLKWSGMPWPESRPQLSLTVSPEVRARMKARLEPLIAGGFGCVVPGAAFEAKRWTSEGFTAVADHLKARWNLSSVVVAGPGQENLAHEVASATRSRATVMYGLDLKELAALLEMARVFVGNDSGPMHVAAALGRPVVAVWGSSQRTVWHPWSDAPWLIVRQETSQESEIKRVAASQVIAAVDEVLELAMEANYKVGIADQAQRVR